MKLPCPRCHGLGATEQQILERISACGALPVVVRDPALALSRCQSCEGLGWWAMSKAEGELLTRIQGLVRAGIEAEGKIGFIVPGVWTSEIVRRMGLAEINRLCAACRHPLINHGRDLDQCGRCSCSRFRFELGRIGNAARAARRTVRRG